MHIHKKALTLIVLHLLSIGTTAVAMTAPDKLTHLVTAEAQTFYDSDNTQDILAAARDTKDYARKHPYAAGSIVAIAAGPQRIGKAITLPFRVVAHTASTMLIVAATTLALINRDTLAAWASDFTAQARASFDTLKEKAAQASSQND